MQPKTINFTKDELKEIIISALNDFQHLPIGNINEEEFLSASQAAQFLKIKLSTLYSKVEKRELPHYRSGKRKLLFKKEELLEYIKNRKIKSATEVNLEVLNYLSRK